MNPIWLLLGLLALEVVGYGVLAGISPSPGGFNLKERLALGFGVGALLVTLWMLALSSLGVPFRLSIILVPLLLLAAAVLLTPRGRRVLAADLKAGRLSWTPALNRWDWLWLGLLAVLLLWATLQATLYPMEAWDAVATWGLKAKVFYLNRALDVMGLSGQDYYPNLVPLLLTYLYMCLGQVNDHLVQGVFPLWGACLLMLLFSILRRLGLRRTQALGLITFLALNGVTLINHLSIAYADLALAYYCLGAAGLVYLWLKGLAPRGCLPAVALCCAGLAWCKYEGPPLAGTVVLAAALTLAWLRPPAWGRRLLELCWPVAGIFLGLLPWRLFAAAHHIEGGSDHILGFYSNQLLEALPMVLAGLVNPRLFGLLWPVSALALVVLGRSLFNSPRLFLALFLGGNLAAILLGYALAPCSVEEFPLYVRGTLDRLLLHITPMAALLVGEGLKKLSLSGTPAPEPQSSRLD